MNKKEEKVFLVLGTLVATMLIWLAMVYALGGCGAQNDYNRYNVRESAYTQSEYLSGDSAVAAEVLVFLGFEIDTMTRNRVATTWERYYYPGHVAPTELQTRIVVDTRNGKIKGQCIQRRVGIWSFRKCSNPIVLKRINQAVEQLQRVLPVKASRVTNE